MRILPNWEKQELKDKLLVLTENNNHNESRLLLTKELMLNDLYNFYCDCVVVLDETEQDEETRQAWFKKRAIADKFLWTIAPEFEETEKQRPVLTFENWYKLKLNCK